MSESLTAVAVNACERWGKIIPLDNDSEERFAQCISVADGPNDLIALIQPKANDRYGTDRSQLRKRGIEKDNAIKLTLRSHSDVRGAWGD